MGKRLYRRTTEGRGRSSGGGRRRGRNASHIRVCSVVAQKRRKKSGIAEVTHRPAKVAVVGRSVTSSRKIITIRVSISLSTRWKRDTVFTRVRQTKIASEGNSRSARDIPLHVSVATAVVAARLLRGSNSTLHTPHAHASGRSARVRALTPVRGWWRRRKSWNPRLKFQGSDSEFIRPSKRFAIIYLRNYVIYIIL